MKTKWTAKPIALVLVLPLVLAGCGEEAADGHDEHDGHDHGAHETHNAAHGGELMELGEHEGHAEVLHDEEAGTLSVWLSGSDMKPMVADAPPVLNFTVDGKPLSVTGEGAAAVWTFRHDALKGEPDNPRLRIKARAKTYQIPIH